MTTDTQRAHRASQARPLSQPSCPGVHRTVTSVPWVEWSRPAPTHTAPREESTDSSTYSTAPARHKQWFSTVNMPVWPCLTLFICVWAHISLTHPLPATHAVLQARLTMLVYMSHSSLLKTGFLKYFKVTQKTCNLFLHNSRRISWSESHQLLTTPSYWSIKQPLSHLREMLS